MTFGMYPSERYYYGWYTGGLAFSPDGDIKSRVVDRLRVDTLTEPYDIKVDVKQSVVVLGGTVRNALAKRAAGDDAWDTPGVVDVSNQIRVATQA
jgi:osmotically-inducible protein OsmY